MRGVTQSEISTAIQVFNRTGIAALGSPCASLPLHPIDTCSRRSRVAPCQLPSAHCLRFLPAGRAVAENRIEDGRQIARLQWRKRGAG